MAYMGTRWNYPSPSTQTTQRIEYTEKSEFNDFTDKVRKDFVRIIDFINNEQVPEINKLETDLEEALKRTEVLKRQVYALQEETSRLRSMTECAPAAKRRLRVTVCAGKDKVQIIRND